jgi:hypothetical protein
VSYTLKVGFTGMHESGKTTTMHDVAAELRRAKMDIFVIDEMARKAPDAGFHLHRDKGFTLQLWVTAAQIKLELEATRRGYDVILVERPVMDALAYAKVSLEDGVMTQQEYGLLSDICWGYARAAPYDYIFALSELHHRGRGEDEGEMVLHRKITGALRSYLDQLGANLDSGLTKVEFIAQNDRNERTTLISRKILQVLSKAKDKSV